MILVKKKYIPPRVCPEHFNTPILVPFSNHRIKVVIRIHDYLVVYSNMQNETVLRAIVARLAVTPVEELPRISGYLATSLSQCSLENHASDNKKPGAPSVTVHKLGTRITSLLQDRSAAGRLTAAVLIKSVVDNGDFTALANLEVWARGLLSCMSKPDPVDVKKTYLATVVRIFIRTQNHPTLLREVTTPLLPPFITTSLGLIRPIKAQIDGRSKDVPSPLLNPVLQCWIQLLPHHATVFRPFVTRIKLLCQSLLDDNTTSPSSRDLSMRTMSLCLACVSKNTFSQEWAQTVSTVVDSARHTADKLLRVVIEEYEPNDKSWQRPAGNNDFSKEPRISEKDQLGLGPWEGVYEGSTRLATLIDFLRHLISETTPQTIAIPVGAILDLTSRLLGITLPETETKATHALRYHKEASRDEKEQLSLNMARVHISCLSLLEKMIDTYGQCLLATGGTLLNRILQAFRSSSGCESIRQATYRILTSVLSTTDVAELKLSTFALLFLIEQCCMDLKKNFLDDTETTKPVPAKDGFLNSKPNSSPNELFWESRSPVYQAAWTLFPQIMICPSSLVSRQSRVEMDRLAVLLDHKDAILASVMHPMVSEKGMPITASLLPFLARSSADEIATEALLRPRMPFLQTSGPSVHESQLATALNGCHEDTNESSEDDDVLSKLENSLPAASAGLTEEEVVTGGAEREYEEIESIPASAPKKRPLEDIDAETTEGSTADQPLLASREPKIPRLGEMTVEDSIVETNGSSNVSVEKPTVGKSPQLQDFAPSSKLAAYSDSDSSDSEVPQIEVDSDTDEEGAEEEDFE